jgi:hypothetical protein
MRCNKAGRPDAIGSDPFSQPCVRIDKDGLVHVCDRTNDRVQVFRKD